MLGNALCFLLLPHILYYDVGGIDMNSNRVLPIVVLVLSLVINFLRPSMVTDLPRVAHGVTLRNRHRGFVGIPDGALQSRYG
ncbi:MAG: hypothetical protein DDT35_01513 [Firmicutes bacterium]|nr:hypothetical protein [Bacillota bacterium]